MPLVETEIGVVGATIPGAEVIKSYELPNTAIPTAATGPIEGRIVDEGFVGGNTGYSTRDTGIGGSGTGLATGAGLGTEAGLTGAPATQSADVAAAERGVAGLNMDVPESERSYTGLNLGTSIGYKEGLEGEAGRVNQPVPATNTIDNTGMDVPESERSYTGLNPGTATGYQESMAGQVDPTDVAPVNTPSQGVNTGNDFNNTPSQGLNTGNEYSNAPLNTPSQGVNTGNNFSNTPSQGLNTASQGVNTGDEYPVQDRGLGSEAGLGPEANLEEGGAAPIAQQGQLGAPTTTTTTNTQTEDHTSSYINTATDYVSSMLPKSLVGDKGETNTPNSANTTTEYLTSFLPQSLVGGQRNETGATTDTTTGNTNNKYTPTEQSQY
jgi:hypothetical protein